MNYIRTQGHGGLLAALTLISLLSGCVVGPDYTRPLVPVDSQYNSIDPAKGVEAASPENLINWWEQFQDPTLSQLTQMALQDNLSIQQYAARIYQYKAQIGVVRSDMFPQFTENGSYFYQHVPGVDSQTWNINTSMSWELDFFGRIKRLTEAATADMEQQNELYRDAQVILIAEIANNYVNARLYEQQINITKKNIEIQKNTYDLAVKKEMVGTNSRLDSAQARGSYKGVESDLATFEAMHKQTLNLLSILTGRTPGAIDEMMKGIGTIPVAPEKILVGIPAELLRNRPDVRAAEQALVAQTSRIGAAIGDLYPQFSLAGSFGIEASDAGNLFDSGIVSGIGPSFKWNILNFGRYRSNIQVQEFRQTEYCLAYRNTILTAAKEVDNALVGYVNEKDRLDKLKEAVEAYDEALKLSQQRYANGTVDFQRVLDTQSNKLKYELLQVQSQANLTNYVVELYKALGGSTQAVSYPQ